MALVKDLIDGLNWEEFLTDRQPSPTDLSIIAVHCFHKTVIIEKVTTAKAPTSTRPRATTSRHHRRDVHVGVDGLLGDLLGRGEQRSDVDVEAHVGERRHR